MTTLRDEPGRQVPRVEMGYWASTVRRWFEDGLPVREPVPGDIPGGSAIMANRGISSTSAKEIDGNVGPCFALDDHLTKFPVDYSPRLPVETVEQTETDWLYRDAFGILCQSPLHRQTPPREIDHPVTDRASWSAYRELHRSCPIEQRLPKNWDRLVEFLRQRDFPIRLGGTYGGFLGFPRQIMGLTNYVLTLYDDPGLIHDICDTFLEFLCAYYGRIMQEVTVDCLLIWEDMAGKQGPLVSPAHFREFMAPRYRKLTAFARDMGVDIILVDSDGAVETLIPLFIESGITGMYPFERAAGNDLERIRETYPDFQLLGGVDKRVLFSGVSPSAIDQELAVAERLLSTGRFIPHIDHFVSPDCTWHHFSYYRRELNQIIDQFNERVNG